MYNKAALVVVVLLASAFDSPPTNIAARTSAAQPVVPLAPPAACQLNYYGGKVLENVVVYAVNWGSSVNSTVVNSIGGFYSAFTGSAMFDWLSEYNTVGLNGFIDNKPGSNQGISHGTFGGSYTITPSITATTITDAQIQSELAAQLTAGKLPPPTLSADGDVTSIYMIDFPFGIKITNGGSSSCVIGGFCAYHGTITYNGKSVPYGVHPDMMNPSSGCFSGCGMDPTSQFNNVTSVHSHELVEAVTDMEIGLTTTVKRPLAWYAPQSSSCGEIGDICNAQQGTLAGYVVQKEWSNAAGACILSKSMLPPICTGPSTPAGCRVCTAADDGFACSGTTPHCETDATNVKYGTCVACTTSAQCSGGTPICGKSATAGADDICRACTNADCSGTTPACETTGTFAGQCVQCTSGNTGACMGGLGTLCDPATDHCVQCVVDGDCMASDQCHAATCSPTTHTCGQTALTGTACTDGNACTTGDTCQAGTCMPGTAKTCAAIDQCHGAGTCNPTNGTCSTPQLANDTPCSDGNACTVNDTCQAGVCTSGAPATCAAGDECHDAATCSMMTGCGSPTAKPDGNACSLGQCQAGVCTAASMPPPDMTMAGGADLGAGDDLGGAADAGDGADLGNAAGSDDFGGNHISGSGGCSCDVSGRATPPWGALVLVAAALFVRRRRRAR